MELITLEFTLVLALMRLLGAKDLGLGDDYHPAKVKLPPVNKGLLSGQLAWRQHDGGHTDEPNVKHFIRWVDQFIHHHPPHQSSNEN